MAEIPRNDVVDLVKRGKSDMDGVGDVLAVEDAAVDIALSQDRDLLGDLKLFERLYQIQVAAPVRFFHSLDLTSNEDGTIGPVLGQFVFPPADREIAAKGLAIVEIGADDGRFQIKTLFHAEIELSTLVVLRFDGNEGYL